jgi:magnesium-transporting ATPase (P-type)
VLAALGRVAGLCNTASLKRPDGDRQSDERGTDRGECAAKDKASAPGGSRAIRWRARCWPWPASWAALAGPAAAKRTIPFDASYRYMAVLHEDEEEGGLILLKGAPEAVLERCDSQMGTTAPRPLDRDWWERTGRGDCREGQRVLALAHKPHKGDKLRHDDVEDGLTLLGFTGLIDPPRPEAIDAVADCHSAGHRR